MATGEVKVRGLRQLHSALKRYDENLKQELEKKLADAGGIVKDDAAARFSFIDPSEGAGYQVSVRGFGRVRVQGKRSKRQRGDFGALLMRSTLLPALSQNAVRVNRSIEQMLDTLGGEFDR